MKAALGMAGILMALAAPAQAALSGYYDSASRIAAILAANEVADALRQAPIRSIEEDRVLESGQSVWIVRSQDCDLAVTLSPTPPKGVGRTEWSVAKVGQCE